MIDLSVLNAEQKEAVLDEKNNLLILACAGSGKTLTITYKIAWAIENGFVYPSQVCAVTFTNRAAKEMKDRITSLLPEVDTSRMVVRTFHSLCASLLRRYPESVGLERNFTIYDDNDSFQVLCSVCNKDKKVLKEISRTISKVKDLGLTPDDPKCAYYSSYPDFRTIYRSYNDALARSGNVDFADLIGKGVELLETNEEARAYCHSRFKLVLVDEYQDSNAEQFKFLSLFVSPSSQLVAVGDDDQSIYSFRGAEIRNILSFADDFKNVREIKLEKNYRSTDQILAPASALIKHNKERHDKEIVSADGKTGPKPVVLVSETGKMEAGRVCDIIRSQRSYSSTAILYRTNAQSLAFETELSRARIPYKVIGSFKFYEREEVKDALAFLRLLLNHRDRVSFERIINKPARKIGDKTVQNICSRDDDLYSALTSFSDDNPSSSGDGARVFLRAWKNAEKRLDEGVNLGEVMTAALDETGLREYYESESDASVRKSRFENLSQLVSALSGNERPDDSIADEDEIEVLHRASTRRDLSDYLERITLDTTVIGNEDPRDKEGVTLITMHNTKGLEYDTVFCTGLENDIIPGRGAATEKTMEEERRILYVALTRARKRLYLSLAKNRLVWGMNKTCTPSPFLYDIPQSLLDGDSIYGRVSSYPREPLPYTQRGASSFTNTPYWARGIAMERKEPKIKTDNRQLEFKKGDRVKALEKGEGTISDISSSGDKTIITVIYDSGRTMRYVAGHANIEKIG